MGSSTQQLPNIDLVYIYTKYVYIYVCDPIYRFSLWGCAYNVSQKSVLGFSIRTELLLLGRNLRKLVSYSTVAYV